MYTLSQKIRRYQRPFGGRGFEDGGVVADPFEHLAGGPGHPGLQEPDQPEVDAGAGLTESPCHDVRGTGEAAEGGGFSAVTRPLASTREPVPRSAESSVPLHMRLA